MNTTHPIHCIIFSLLFYCFSLSAASTKEIVFKDIPLVVEETSRYQNGENILNITVFNPTNTVSNVKNIPFLKIQKKKLKDGNDVFTVIKIFPSSENTSLELIELTKMLAKEYTVPLISFIDNVKTTPCSKEGVWCNHEPTHAKSLQTIYLTGQSFFEQSTDGSPIEKTTYHKAANYLYQTLRIDHLVQDLYLMGALTPKALTTAQFLLDASSTTGVEITDRVSTLFKRAQLISDDDEESHRLWHDIQNQLVGSNGHSIIETADYVLTKQNLYPEIVKQYCSDVIINYCLELGSFSNLEHHLVFPKDWLVNSRLAYVCKHLDNLIEMQLTQSRPYHTWYIIDTDFTLRAPELEAEKKGLLMQFSAIPRLSEIYNRAVGYSSSVKQNHKFSDWDKLADWINEESTDDMAPGITYLKWHACKTIIEKFNFFRFTVESNHD